MNDFREKSYWLGTRDYVPESSLGQDLSVDVAIVGGGFTGLSAACHLMKYQPGMTVALLESQVIGFGASGRNGGFNMTLFGLTMGVTALRFGKRKAREAHHYMERAVDYLRDMVAELNLDCDYEHPGFLRVATSEAYRKRILHEIDLIHKLGLTGISWLDGDQVQREVRSPQYLGAWWEPRCGILNPAKLAWSWKDVIVPMGVRVFENTSVERIEPAGGRVRLTTPCGCVSADRVLLATNAYSHLIPGFKRKQAPIWTHIVLTEPIPDNIMEQIGWRNRQGIEDARNLVHYYRLTADNRLLMGGRDVSFAYGEGMDRDLNNDVFKGLEEDVRAIFPPLKNIRFTHRWGGPVSITTDLAPAIGLAGGGKIIYSIGCIGHGVSLTHLNGRTLAELALDRKTDLTDVFFVNRRVLPWPPEPVRNIASHALLAAMKIQDRFTDKQGASASQPKKVDG